MIVPWQAVQPETLDNLIEEYVTRDGTDYGEQETSLSRRVEQIRTKLQSGEAVLLFSESTGLCNIVAKDSLS
ncbi:YheU family protein [Neptuniibacter sp. CAU 1671]|uniref:YheU family protein n=1 Tax=Neptuniibacter sp. CAU 1671 TaxID=3032593 RepID=UPI0023DBEA8C|nr:YheU family protein [Neptuniibacter sp. CAU 1671]MDF2181390.1 YheU family protein [Neptuniibacter sp. CAU 1671]